MAVSIDTVYQKVLAMANKEQRGYITPQEFNLYADQAQIDIFERYFHDIRQAETRMETDTEFSSSLDMLDEKLSVFRVNDQILYPTSYDGSITLPSDLYRLGELTYCVKDDTSNYNEYLKIPIEEIKKKDIGPILNSKYTRPTTRRPAFVRLTNSTIRIYPHATSLTSNNNDSYYILGPAQYFTLLGDLTTTDASAEATFTSTNNSDRITEYYQASGHMPQIIGTGIPSGTTVLTPFPKSGTTNTLTMSEQATITATIQAVFAMGNTKCNYIKRPTTPNWSYVEINGTALYNSTNSIDFELHASEESALVSRITQLAGITLKDNNLLQIGSAEESKIVQSQKQ